MVDTLMRSLSNSTAVCLNRRAAILPTHMYGCNAINDSYTFAV